MPDALPGTSWQQLTAIPIPGGWRWETVAVGGSTWKLLLPASQDAFLKESADPEKWPDPFWTQIWPAAQALAAQVLCHDWPVNTCAVELGCGSGLVGLALLARGCRVTFSDYVPLAVALAVANARENGFQQASGVVLDWRTPGDDPQFNLIIAADVLYDSELHAALLETIQQRLRPGGFVWLGDPGRSEHAEEFLLLATASGWEVALYDESGRGCASLQRGEYRRLELRRGKERG